MTPEEQLHPLLKSFKDRMRIFHTGEDNNLSKMLESSESDMSTMTKLNFSTETFKEI